MFKLFIIFILRGWNWRHWTIGQWRWEISALRRWSSSVRATSGGQVGHTRTVGLWSVLFCEDRLFVPPQQQRLLSSSLVNLSGSHRNHQSFTKASGHSESWRLSLPFSPFLSLWLWLINLLNASLTLRSALRALEESKYHQRRNLFLTSPFFSSFPCNVLAMPESWISSVGVRIEVICSFLFWFFG